MSYKTFGKRPDGTLEICRAREENRGKGRCTHGEHMRVSDTQINSGFIDEFNEDVLSETYGNVSTNRTGNSFPEEVSEDSIMTHSGGKALSREELLDGAQKISERFTDDDWSLMRGFYESFNKSIRKRLSDVEIKERYDDISKNVADYLKSDEPSAIRSREFLGKDIDIDEFSKILTHQVKAMTAVEEWRGNRSSSLRRVVLTSLDNDMTRERYVASVLFFGGRCCYCNCILRKSPPPTRQASGEHLTPITPDDPNDVHGGTRYGNMVLACVRCNNSRGNQELVSWIQKTNCIPNKDKQMALGRIQAFRRFTLYHEYSQEENARIVSTIRKLEKRLASLKSSDGGTLTTRHRNEFKREIKVALYDLKHSNSM